MTMTQREVNIVVGSATMGTFLGALEQTIVATALPSIARDLGDFTLLPWVVTAYLLTSTCIMPVMGKLSDIYGRNRMMTISLVLFVIGSGCSALAPGMIPLIIARALQGAGGGGVMALAQAIIADVVSPRDRGKYSAFFSAVWATAAIIGPTVGGFLTQYQGWPSIFWINVPLGLLTLAVTRYSLRKLPIKLRRAPVDQWGILLLCGGTVTLLLVLSLGGKRLAWLSPEIMALAGSVLVLGLFLVFQQKRAPDPILPPKFFRDRVTGPAFSSSFVVHAAYLSTIVLTPIYFQVALGTPTAHAGLALIPALVAVNIATTWSGNHCRKSGHYRMPTLVCLPIAAIPLGILAFLADSVSPLAAVALLTVAGFGYGPIFPCTMVAAQNAVQNHEMGSVTGTITFIRALGGAIGIAASSALLLGLISTLLPAMGHFSSLEDLARSELPPEARVLIAGAFGKVYAAIAVALLVGLALFSRIEDRSLHDRPATVPDPAD